MNTIIDHIGLRRVTLRELEPDLNNILIVGIIIAKQRPKKIVSPRSGISNTNEIRAVWNFTLRDSPRDYINVNFWGNVDEIFAINDKYYIGDVVEIVRPQISIRKFNDTGEQYRPMVTSPFTLTLTCNSKVLPHNEDSQFFFDLMSLPTKPMAGYVPLRDIHKEGAAMKDLSVDILGVVRNVSSPRNITTKQGEEVQLREVIIFDHTNPALKITIWDPNIMTRACAWKPRETVLFITDVKITYTSFLKTYSASLTSRSIVTENPVGKEAANLAIYARNAPLEVNAIMNQLTTTFPHPESIKNVMSIQQIHNVIKNLPENHNNTEQQITALLYVFVTQLDLDGLLPNISRKCIHCKGFVRNELGCENVDCPSVLGLKPKENETYFDIRVHLTDHTGTLPNCRLSGQLAENILGCTVQDFLRMSDDEKSHLKWKYLMEWCAVRIFILPLNRNVPIISILSCETANALEVVQKMPIY